MADRSTDERWDAFGFDPGRYDRWTAVCAGYARWLSTAVHHLERVPEEGPVLLVGNHAGLRLLDVMCLQAVVRRRHPARRAVRPLFHIGLEKKLLYGHLLGQYAGGVIGHPRNAEYLLARGDVVLTYPEGNRTTSKAWADRDRLRPREEFGRGWARLAVASGAAVVPVTAAGFEAAVPTVFRSRALGRFWLSNADLYPVSPQSLLTATVPSLNWVAPFPVPTALVFGEPRFPVSDGSGPAERAERLWDDVYREIAGTLDRLREGRGAPTATESARR